MALTEKERLKAMQNTQTDEASRIRRDAQAARGFIDIAKSTPKTQLRSEDIVISDGKDKAIWEAQAREKARLMEQERRPTATLKPEPTKAIGNGVPPPASTVDSVTITPEPEAQTPGSPVQPEAPQINRPERPDFKPPERLSEADILSNNQEYINSQVEAKREQLEKEAEKKKSWIMARRGQLTGGGRQFATSAQVLSKFDQDIARVDSEMNNALDKFRTDLRRQVVEDARGEEAEQYSRAEKEYGRQFDIYKQETQQAEAERKRAEEIGGYYLDYSGNPVTDTVTGEKIKTEARIKFENEVRKENNLLVLKNMAADLAEKEYQLKIDKEKAMGDEKAAAELEKQMQQELNNIYREQTLDNARYSTLMAAARHLTSTGKYIYKVDRDENGNLKLDVERDAQGNLLYNRQYEQFEIQEERRGEEFDIQERRRQETAEQQEARRREQAAAEQSRLGISRSREARQKAKPATSTNKASSKKVSSNNTNDDDFWKMIGSFEQ